MGAPARAGPRDPVGTVTLVKRKRAAQATVTQYLADLDLSFRFVTGDGLSTPGFGADTTHLLLNPPFGSVPSQKGLRVGAGAR